MLHQRPAVDSVARSAAAQVRGGVLSPIMAAETIISALFAEGVAAGTAGGVGHPLTAADGTVTLPCEERERSTPYGFSSLIAWSRILDDEEALCIVNGHGTLKFETPSFECVKISPHIPHSFLK